MNPALYQAAEATYRRMSESNNIPCKELFGLLEKAVHLALRGDEAIRKQTGGHIFMESSKENLGMYKGLTEMRHEVINPNGTSHACLDNALFYIQEIRKELKY